MLPDLLLGHQLPRCIGWNLGTSPACLRIPVPNSWCIQYVYAFWHTHREVDGGLWRRLAFAGGAALAYADGVGHAAGEAAAAWLERCAPLWAAVAAAAEAGTRQEACLAEGIQATDSWAAETGGLAVRACVSKDMFLHRRGLAGTQWPVHHHQLIVLADPSQHHYPRALVRVCRHGLVCVHTDTGA